MEQTPERYPADHRSAHKGLTSGNRSPTLGRGRLVTKVTKSSDDASAEGALTWHRLIVLIQEERKNDRRNENTH